MIQRFVQKFLINMYIRITTTEKNIYLDKGNSMSSTLFSKKLQNGYEIREMLDDDFWPLIEKHHLQVFQDTIQFNWRDHAPKEDLEKTSELTKNLLP
ncbi:MAG: hypothetical protein AB7I27_17660 [Bacteriovoracaceae bacterium]